LECEFPLKIKIVLQKYTSEHQPWFYRHLNVIKGLKKVKHIHPNVVYIHSLNNIEVKLTMNLMKNSVFTIATVFGLLVLSVDWASAQQFGAIDKSPADIALLRADRESAPVAKVVYSRPQKKGRDMFSADADLAPAGKVWRTGANETTEITFWQDVTFAGKKVKSGTYAFYTIPGDGKWIVVLNSKLNTWGHFQYDESKDVIRAEVSSRKYEGAEIEAFSIKFASLEGNKSTLYLGWGTTVVDVPVEI